MRVMELDHRGWTILRLRSDVVGVDIAPGKGGDILQVRWLPMDLNVLWTTPWGLRARAATAAAGDSYVRFMQSYPGGWQTIFPNGGRATEVLGVEQPFHGEACLASWDYDVSTNRVELRTTLGLSPFRLTKTILLDGARLEVEETVQNVGGIAFDAMWSHHPAFGSPFLDGECVLDTAARTFLSDAHHDSQFLGGRRSEWPHAAGASRSVDLSRVPAEGSGVTWFGYLTDFDRGWASVTSPSKRMRAQLEWSTDVFPHAWLWVEANANPAFPAYGSWYVMAVEPASSYPGHGIDAARETGTLVRFEPGQSRTAHVSLTLAAV